MAFRHPYYPQACEWQREPLQSRCEYGDEILEKVRELVGSNTERVFICGGFAAYLAGFTDEFGDVDLFILDSFGTKEYLTSKINKGQLVQESHEFTRVADWNGLQVDLIARQETSIQELICHFDFNWVMIAVDLANNEIVYHPDAGSDQLVLNKRRRNQEVLLGYGGREIIRTPGEHVKGRIRKYMTRMRHINVERANRILAKKIK